MVIAYFVLTVGVLLCVILVNQLLTDGTRRQLTCCDQAVWDHSSE